MCMKMEAMALTLPVSDVAPGRRATVVRSARGWTRATWVLLVVLCGALFLDGLDVSMVGVALPSIQADLGLTTAGLQWIVSGYVLGYGGLLLLRGRRAHPLRGSAGVLTAGGP